MATFLYIETNCIMGMAKGREPLVMSLSFCWVALRLTQPTKILFI
jgi:hypothetical protein